MQLRQNLQTYSSVVFLVMRAKNTGNECAAYGTNTVNIWWKTDGTTRNVASMYITLASENKRSWSSVAKTRALA